MLRSIYTHRNISYEGAMEGLSNSVAYVAVATPVLEFAVGYKTKNSKMMMNGVQTAVGFAFNEALTWGFKNSLQRERPFVTYPYLDVSTHSSDASFPSGHTSFAFSTATSLSLCYPKWYVVAPSFIWASYVGYSRLYLGLHYPTDVLFGALIGAGSSWISMSVNKYLQHRRNEYLLIDN